MNMTRCNQPQVDGPLGEVDQLFRSAFSQFPGIGRLLDLEGLLDGPSTMRSIPVDIFEDDNTFVVRLELPGVKRDAIDIELDAGVLNVTAERPVHLTEANTSESSTDEADTDQQPAPETAPTVTLTRKLSVPKSVDGQAVKADLADGILTLTLPKLEDSKPRNIEIG